MGKLAGDILRNPDVNDSIKKLVGRELDALHAAKMALLGAGNATMALTNDREYTEIAREAVALRKKIDAYLLDNGYLRGSP